MAEETTGTKKDNKVATAYLTQPISHPLSKINWEKQFRYGIRRRSRRENSISPAEIRKANCRRIGVRPTSVNESIPNELSFHETAWFSEFGLKIKGFGKYPTSCEKWTDRRSPPPIKPFHFIPYIKRDQTFRSADFPLVGHRSAQLNQAGFSKH